MQVSFYLLNDNKAQDILGFVCQLTQKVLLQSSAPLAIVASDRDLLTQLDTLLWTQQADSFIPHQLMDNQETPVPTETRQVPIAYLCQTLPPEFQGLVLNLNDTPIGDASTHLPQGISRILEIIRPDDNSVATGRDKYKHYQQQGATLEHFRL